MLIVSNSKKSNFITYGAPKQNGWYMTLYRAMNSTLLRAVHIILFRVMNSTGITEGFPHYSI